MWHFLVSVPSQLLQELTLKPQTTQQLEQTWNEPQGCSTKLAVIPTSAAPRPTQEFFHAVKGRE